MRSGQSRRKLRDGTTFQTIEKNQNVLIGVRVLVICEAE